MARQPSREAEIEKKIADFGGLIDRPTAKLLVEYEAGDVAEEKIQKIRDRLEKMLNSQDEGVVLEVEAERGYSRKDGGRGSFVGIKIGLSDGREGRVVLWDKQIEDADLEKAKPGERLVLLNCTFNEGRYGLTINTGRSGSLRLQNGTLLYPIRK